jgi:hypothetical protein
MSFGLANKGNLVAACGSIQLLQQQTNETFLIDEMNA